MAVQFTVPAALRDSARAVRWSLDVDPLELF
jgi:hypothetical protein